MKDRGVHRFRTRRAIAVACLLTLPATVSAEDITTTNLQTRLGDVFHRTMAHWGFGYDSLPERRAGVACVPWDGLTEEFLANEIFGAIGFSYSMADDGGAVSVAERGCEIMKSRKKVSGCECETVLLNEEVVVSLPDGAGE